MEDKRNSRRKAEMRKEAHEPTMPNEKKRSLMKPSIVALACILFSGALWGQTTDPANAPKPATPPAAPQVQPETSKPAPSPQSDYIIGAEDVLVINVWQEKDISRSVTVRSDGAISLPLVGEVQASGKTPTQLEREIQTKLKAYISEPEVTVIVQEMKSKRFNVMGEVVKPGSYLLTNSTTVLDAIAMSGGFRDFAKQKSIYVLRRNDDGTDQRLPFNYKDVIKGKNVEQNVKLEPRDTVVVP